jgi:hypothetical protein
MKSAGSWGSGVCSTPGPVPWPPLPMCTASSRLGRSPPPAPRGHPRARPPSGPSRPARSACAGGFGRWYVRNGLTEPSPRWSGPRGGSSTANPPSTARRRSCTTWAGLSTGWRCRRAVYSPLRTATSAAATGTPRLSAGRLGPGPPPSASGAVGRRCCPGGSTTSAMMGSGVPPIGRSGTTSSAACRAPNRPHPARPQPRSASLPPARLPLSRPVGSVRPAVRAGWSWSACSRGPRGGHQEPQRGRVAAPCRPHRGRGFPTPWPPPTRLPPSRTPWPAVCCLFALRPSGSPPAFGSSPPLPTSVDHRDLPNHLTNVLPKRRRLS